MRHYRIAARDLAHPSELNEYGQPLGDSTPGKRTVTEELAGRTPGRRRAAEWGGGMPLPDPVRTRMEHSFGADFSAVRVRESASASSLGADAMASGNEIQFAPGMWDPSSERGLSLLGHELAHVVQQAQGRVAGAVQGKGFAVNDAPALEREADEMGERAARGEPAGGSSDAPAHGDTGPASSPGPLQLRRRLTEAEDPAQWDAFSTGDTYLGDTSDVQLGAALTANRALGFSSVLIGALRERVGLGPRPREINIDFCASFRLLQGGMDRPAEAVTETARPRDVDEGDVSGGETGSSARGVTPGNGILDEQWIRRLDLAHHTSFGAARLEAGETRGHDNRRPWATMDDATRERAIAAVRAALGADAVTVEEETVGRRTRHTIRISVARAIDWQAWHRRSDAMRAGEFGTIGAADLALMGVTVPEPAAGAEPGAGTPGTASEPAEAGTEAAEEAESEDGLNADQRAGLERFRAQLDEYVQARTRARQDAQRAIDERRRAERAARRSRGGGGRGGGAGGTGAGETGEPETPPPPLPTPAEAARAVDDRYDVQAISEEIAALGVPGLSAAEVRRPRGSVEHGWARTLIGLIDEIINPAVASAAAARAGGARHRRSPEEIAAARARIADYVIRDEALDSTLRDREGNIINDGYSQRLTTAADEAAGLTVTVIAHRAVASLTELAAELTRAKDHLHDLVTAARGRSAEAIQALRAQLVADAGHDWTVPRVLRQSRPWRPPALPRTNPDRVPTETPEIIQLGNTWYRGFVHAIGETNEERGRNAAYETAVRPVNPRAVIVDLHRTGVEICWNPGNTLPVSEMHLDPAFAEKMIDYLNVIRSVGVTKLYTAGFLRAAMSPADTHPFGRAVDITGYCVGGVDIRLRGGYPLQETDPRYDDTARGHSDWFDDSHRLNDRGPTHRDIMLALAVRLRDHFTTIVGPGHNEQHMNHFHVEISTYEGDTATMYAVSDPAAMPEWAEARIARGTATAEGGDGGAGAGTDE